MAASGPTSRLLLAGVWTGIALQVAGQAIDLRWHATHPGFERAADQLQAHWLIWLGVLVTLAVAAVGARRVPSSWHSGYRLLLLAGIAYTLSSGWPSGSTPSSATRRRRTCWWQSARPRSWPGPCRRPS